MVTIHKILHERGGWCVAKKMGDRWHRVSNLYRFRGWAQAFARRMKIDVVNHESNFA